MSAPHRMHARPPNQGLHHMPQKKWTGMVSRGSSMRRRLRALEAASISRPDVRPIMTAAYASTTEHADVMPTRPGGGQRSCLRQGLHRQQLCLA